MVRQDTVAVRVKEGKGQVTFCAGQKYILALKPDEVATTWADGSPIFRTEFANVLEREDVFEIVPEKVAGEAKEKK